MTEKVETKGRKSLIKAIEKDIKEKRTFRTEKELWEVFDWIVARAQHYADHTGYTVDDILNTWEEKRNYWYLNFYQDANQPEINADEVYVYPNAQSLVESLDREKYRCPSCGGVSENPYVCTSGKINEGSVCDWKAYGLLKTLGNGVSIFIRDEARVIEIFQPIAWE